MTSFASILEFSSATFPDSIYIPCVQPPRTLDISSKSQETRPRYTELASSYSVSNPPTYLFLCLTVVNCGSLSNPARGHVSHTGGTTFGKSATYSCNTGYNLVGSSIRTCQTTRVWSGSAPTCQGNYFLQVMLQILLTNMSTQFST